MRKKSTEQERTQAVTSSDLLCHVRMFKPQFAPLVVSGDKCQTVRPTPKRMPRVGDRISLRMWSGKPYRSKQRILRTSEITGVERVEIRPDRILVAGKDTTPSEEWAFAKADGFNTPKDMLEWFAMEHGLPFEGIVIGAGEQPPPTTKKETNEE